jgi:hypothetical protein
VGIKNPPAKFSFTVCFDIASVSSSVYICMMYIDFYPKYPPTCNNSYEMLVANLDVRLREKIINKLRNSF